MLSKPRGKAEKNAAKEMRDYLKDQKNDYRENDEAGESEVLSESEDDVADVESIDETTIIANLTSNP
jgi:hypothetical protein